MNLQRGFLHRRHPQSPGIPPSVPSCREPGCGVTRPQDPPALSHTLITSVSAGVHAAKLLGPKFRAPPATSPLAHGGPAGTTGTRRSTLGDDLLDLGVVLRCTPTLSKESLFALHTSTVMCVYRTGQVHVYNTLETGTEGDRKRVVACGFVIAANVRTIDTRSAARKGRRCGLASAVARSDHDS